MGRSYRGIAPRPRGMQPLVRDVFDVDRLPPSRRQMQADVLARISEPYVGLTTDGQVRRGLYHLDGDPEADMSVLVEAASDYLVSLSPSERAEGQLPMQAEQWRRWTNAFPVWQPHGLLLQDFSSGQREAALSVLRASLSPSGYQKTRTVMLLNQILGEIIDDYRGTLREWMYRFTVFGTPSTVDPWGWQLAGHHLDIHCVVVGGRIVLTPTFMGAEPVAVDDGPHAGLRIFEPESRSALDLMQSLDEAQQQQATIFPSMLTADLPDELNHVTEGRMRATAGGDNVVLPYQGLPVAYIDLDRRELLMRVIANYVEVGPAGHAAYRIRQAREHLDTTFFSWVGQHGDNDPFYYRIHSPVILIEFDHHRGVFLSNEDPENIHIHTIVRSPNGHDYGRDLLRQHYALHHQKI